MKNITLAIDERLLEESREYARRQGTSLNGLVRQLLKELIEKPNEAGLSGLWEMFDKLESSSNGWKFNREEIYDRKILR